MVYIWLLDQIQSTFQITTSRKWWYKAISVWIKLVLWLYSNSGFRKYENQAVLHSGEASPTIWSCYANIPC
jgi:hypothetical protein